MSDTASIKAFSDRASKLKRLDAAILNAGILTENWEVLNSMESTIAVNAVGTMLLTTLLLPTLRQSAAKTGLRGRLSIVGSDIISMALARAASLTWIVSGRAIVLPLTSPTIATQVVSATLRIVEVKIANADLGNHCRYMADTHELQTEGTIMEKINDQAQSQMAQRYPLSKVLLFYSVQELARRAPLTDKSDVILSVMTPGACKSDIFRDDAGLIKRMVMGVMIGSMARTTEVGGRTLVLSAAPDLTAEAHGRFLMDTKVAKNGNNVDSPAGHELAEKWNKELFAHLEKLSPGCTQL
ncbi:hypothetical protein LTR56_000019 [Elasticomyces elasticus]|nr:hypothetical protein LTR22_016370 [Elasticomyces elasticus]KAK3661533.1 hypothetical protein LTR56_000019 [Elasticomyces elasticus]KAK4932784.1 hypothetical protein LTR49_000738 [Elasticomyces elasticus]KAK5758229.1 hypothetical protein LTS12_011699 [Elasticomyces elasticus]